MKRMLIVSAFVLALGAMFVATAQAQDGPRRGGMMMGRGGSIAGLLGSEQVQKEIKLTDEQKTKVDEAVKAVREEIGEKFTALRELEDRSQMREKMQELSTEMDRALMGKLRGVLEREQFIRAMQIRLQLRPLADSLESRFLAERLKITDEQKEKFAAFKADTQKQMTELMSKMREASQEQRGELFGKFRELREGAEKKVLAVLTDDQKKQIEEMKGEKFEFEYRRPQR